MNHNIFISPVISDDKVLGNTVESVEEEVRHWKIFQFSVNIKLSYTKINKSYKNSYWAQNNRAEKE